MQNEVTYAFHDKLGGESPKLLTYELLGWFLEPNYQIDIVSLQRFWRWRAHFPVWAEDLPIQHLASQWHVHLPGVTSVFQKLGWWTEQGGAFVCRRDEAGGIRRIHVGYESVSALRDWLQAHYRQKYVRRCARIWQSYHRGEVADDLAVGLALPSPMPSYRPALIGHRTAWQDAHDEHTRKAAFITWACESTRELRQGIHDPAHRGEERLLAMHLPEQPPPPPGVDLGGLREDIADAVYDALQGHSKIALACDGSSKQDVAAFSVVVHDVQCAFAGGDGLEDQSAYRAEFQGLFFALGATVDAAQTGARGEVVVLCDCFSALKTVSSQNGDVSLLAQSIASFIQEAGSLGVKVHLEWIPSHGKRPDWQPSFEADPLYLRSLNDAADAAAKQSAERRLAGSLRARWAILTARCAKWEYQAVQLAAGAACQLHQHLMQF